MKNLSAKQFKKYFCNSTAERRAVVKFEKAQSLMQAKELRELRKLSDSWDKRTSSNVRGFYDKKKARLQYEHRPQ